MKIALRHTITNLYLQSPEKWTEIPELALDFRFSDRAVEFAQTWGLARAEVAVVYEEELEVKSRPVWDGRGAQRRQDVKKLKALKR